MSHAFNRLALDVRGKIIKLVEYNIRKLIKCQGLVMLHARADSQRRRLRRVGKTRQSAPNVRAHRLGQDEQYLPYVRSCSEHARRWCAITRAQLFLPVWVCNIRVLGFTLLIKTELIPVP